MSAKGALFSLFGFVGLVVCFNSKQCYWNSNCLYDKFGIATPYDTVRGDLRDQKEDSGCEVLSIWSLHRHGNRNPGAKITKEISELQRIIKQKLHHHHFNRKHNKNCAQDMEDLMNWRWNSTLENSATYLTGTGYEELYDIGRRMYIQYQNFLKSTDEVVFRATNSQRTETSLVAFVHGLTDGTPLANFSAGIRPSLERDDFLRPYDDCERYQEEVEDGQLPADELAAYDSSPDYMAIRDKVQERLPVDYRLKYADVFTLYQLCRFERSWSARLRSPWCALFSDSDLKVLEYRDDVRHYYNNGYGSWMNPKLGALPLRDLYENFVSSTEGNGKSLVSYFTHDTMMDMVFSALGLYKDTEPLRGSKQNVTRLWRTSQLATFATNFIAVLSRCNELGVQTHRVRLFINEKPTPLCPSKGCTWEQFLDIFQGFRDANLNFCAKESSKNGTVAL